MMGKVKMKLKTLCIPDHYYPIQRYTYLEMGYEDNVHELNKLIVYDDIVDFIGVFICVNEIQIA